MKTISGKRGDHASREFKKWGMNSVLNMEFVSAAKAVVFYENKILLIKNHRGRELPGGHLEDGETPQECIIREVREESGFVIGNISPYAYLEVSNHTEKINKATGQVYPARSIVLYYRGFLSDLENKSDDIDSDDVGFFDLDAEEFRGCSEYEFVK